MLTEEGMAIPVPDAGSLAYSSAIKDETILDAKVRS